MVPWTRVLGRKVYDDDDDDDSVNLTIAMSAEGSLCRVLPVICTASSGYTGNRSRPWHRGVTLHSSTNASITVRTMYVTVCLAWSLWPGRSAAALGIITYSFYGA